MSKLAKKITTKDRTHHPVEVKRHKTRLSDERTDDVLESVVDLILNFLKCECNRFGNHNEKLRDRLAEKE